MGLIVNDDFGLWTWRLGERAGQPDIVRGTLSRPVPWQGGYIAIRTWSADDRDVLSVWRLDPDDAVDQGDGLEPTPSEPEE